MFGDYKRKHLSLHPLLRSSVLKKSGLELAKRSEQNVQKEFVRKR